LGGQYGGGGTIPLGKKKGDDGYDYAYPDEIEEEEPPVTHQHR
jgi:hypothetical protein